jgi:hypothetical protein
MTAIEKMKSFKVNMLWGIYIICLNDDLNFELFTLTHTLTPQ